MQLPLNNNQEKKKNTRVKSTTFFFHEMIHLAILADGSSNALDVRLDCQLPAKHWLKYLRHPFKLR